MAKGPCPNCKTPLTIAQDQRTVTCEACGSVYQVGRKEGKIRLRPVEAAPASPKAATEAAVKAKAKPAQKAGGSNRMFLILVGLLATLLVISLIMTLIIVLSP